jgi:hypothetical protein
MQNYLDNILIPISKGLDIQMAVTKALELAGPGGATVHLVHLIRPHKPFRMFRQLLGKKVIPINDLDGYLRILIDLIHWKKFIERKSSGITVKIHIKRGLSLRPFIAQIAKRERTGLIISAAHLKWGWFLKGENISVIELISEVETNMLMTLFKPLSGKRILDADHFVTAKGFQVLLSNN